MVLTPAPPSRALTAMLYTLALAAGTAGAFLLRTAAAAEDPDERLALVGLTGVLLAFALLMVAAAEGGRRGVLLWRAEDGRLVGYSPHSGEQVGVPVVGPVQVEMETRPLSNGVNIEQYSVWVFSPVLGPMRLLGGAAGSADEVRARWEAARLSGGHLELPAQPPPGSGVRVEADGSCRIPAGWGGLALPFLASALFMVSPVVVVMLLRGTASLWVGGVLALAAAVTLLTLLYAFSHWELRAGPEGLQARRRVGPLSLGAPRPLPADLRLDLSRAPIVKWVDGTGKPRLRAVAVARGATLAGVLWLTANLRRLGR